MSQVLIFLIFFCVYSIDASTVHWSGYTDGNWWNSANWNCDRGNDLCQPTQEDDVVFDPSDCNFCIRHITLGIALAQVRSLVIKSNSDFQFTLDILSGIGLSVGSGGITIDKLSTVYLYGKIWSQGNVKADGTFLLQSGELYGPGNFTFSNLVASSCFLFAHVIVSTDLNVEPQAPGLADTILIQPNGSLTVYGNLITDNPITISGKINVNNSVTFLAKNETFRYVLTGNIPQTFGSISVPTGILVSSTPIITQNLFVGTGANVQINYDCTIGNASGSGLISVLYGNVKLGVSDPNLEITSVGNLVIIGHLAGIVTVNGGVLTTDLNGGSMFTINNLTVVRGTLHLSPMTVAKLLYLGDGVIVQQGSLNVTNNAVSVGSVTIYKTVVVIEKGATFEQQTGNFQLYGDTDDTQLVFINEGVYVLKGNLRTYLYMGGSGVWNIDGTWLIGFECNISGTINLIGNSTINFENMYLNYNLGTVRGGGLFGNVGFLVAKELSVNSIDEQFSQLTVDNITTENYISRCCGQKKIGTLHTDKLDLETGSYSFSVGKGLISNVMLMDGVNLGFQDTADITNLQFMGGSLESDSDNSVTISVRNTTYLSSASQKMISGTLETAILDCTGCLNPSCNLVGWGNIKAATTRGRCANRADLLS